MASDYRNSVAAFLEATGWRLSPAEQRNLARVLSFFADHPTQRMDEPDIAAIAPGTCVAYREPGRTVTRLVSWIQSMDLHYPVDPHARVHTGTVLVRFQTTPQKLACYSHFYVAPGDKHAQEGPARLGAPRHGPVDELGRAQRLVPVAYAVLQTFIGLESTAADAFLSWCPPEDYPLSYEHGGRRQLFVPRPDDVLK